MANGFDIDQALPDPDATLPGDPISATEIARLCGTLNLANAWVGSGPVFQQSWPHGRCSHAGATPQVEGVDVPIARWYVPLPTSHHRTLVVYVLAERVGAGDASVTLRSVGNDAELPIELAADAADEWSGPYTLDLDVAEDGADIVEMYLSTVAPTVARVYQIAAELEPLASPLPGEVIVGEGVDSPPLPTGETAGAGRPLHSWRGMAISASASHIGERYLPVYAYSPLSTAYTGPVEGDAGPRPLPPTGVVSHPAGVAPLNRRIGVEGVVSQGRPYRVRADGMRELVYTHYYSVEASNSGGGLSAQARSMLGGWAEGATTTLVGTPTQGATMRTWASNARLLASLTRRSAPLHVGIGDPFEPRYLGADGCRILWRAGPHVGRLMIALWFGGSVGSGGDWPTLSASLRTLSGEIVDDELSDIQIPPQGADWVDYGGYLSLNAHGHAGEWLELRIETTDARIAEAHVIELHEITP